MSHPQYPQTPTPSGAVKYEESAEISVVSVSDKIPNFWPDNPRLWFLQVEAILGPQKTSDLNKYYMIVGKLSKDVVQQIADILANPPETGKFDTLKKRLLQIYEESETRQVQKLVSEMELGEQKPSQLLRRMKELATDKIKDETLKILWKGHLPSAVQAVLTVTSTKDLEEMAIIADKIMETNQSAQVNEVARGDTKSTIKFDIATIMAEIAKINLKINEMDRGRQRYRGRSGRRDFSRSRTRSRPRRTSENADWLCSYHWKYGQRARKCVEPCNWKNKNSPPKSEN